MNIVVCCDGTNNQFGPQNTNVVRLIQCLDRDPTKQQVYYDPGVGTLPEPGIVSQIGTGVSQLIQQALGIGVMGNVIEAYTYLMNYWQPGDRVYMFGFSRGAYTVRVLAGMLHMLGLLPKGNENLIPYVSRLYKSIRETPRDTASKQWNLWDDFRKTFSRDVGDDRHFSVHFLGVWDTVSSVGWFWSEPSSYPYTRQNPSIQNIWHAVSIDEHRAFFRQNLMEVDKHNPTQRFHQRWFPGDHSDVGGGHPAAMGGLWRCSFEWMIWGAYDADLLLNEAALNEVLKNAPQEPWAEAKHDLLGGYWKLAEYVPKRHWNSVENKWEYRCNMSRPRSIQAKAVIDRSALQRLQRTSLEYQPGSFSDDFSQYVARLANVPDGVEYQPQIPPTPDEVPAPVERRPRFNGSTASPTAATA